MTTSKFNKEFNRIVSEDKAWDFEIHKDGILITYNGGKVFTTIGSLKPLDELKEDAIYWLENRLKRMAVFNVGDNVLIPQTKDEKNNPNIKAVVTEVKLNYLVVQVDNFTVPVPRSYCKKVSGK